MRIKTTRRVASTDTYSSNKGKKINTARYIEQGTNSTAVPIMIEVCRKFGVFRRGLFLLHSVLSSQWRVGSQSARMPPFSKCPGLDFAPPPPPLPTLTS